ncbi:uncharacterized protein EI90DRAFT_3020926 [Cantharellus anzutake]|uniref:uncharacterized protein n=1 Tax=Cantharellus anzutake TaxID=1750568 RepID=UPI0019062908|nr:uncharacterized protein EI90DRAFT_3020926 [Cantharellus anzutake]KAF8318872.1 hypothetical protein EI90DRAFT_3020926 [Cantharellus anzutake]
MEVMAAPAETVPFTVAEHSTKPAPTPMTSRMCSSVAQSTSPAALPSSPAPMGTLPNSDVKKPKEKKKKLDFTIQEGEEGRCQSTARLSPDCLHTTDDTPAPYLHSLIIIPGLAQTFVIFPSAERPRFAGYTDFIIPWVASEEDNFLLSLPLAAQLESLSQSALLGSPIETDPVPLGVSSSEGSGFLDLESEQLGTLTAHRLDLKGLVRDLKNGGWKRNWKQGRKLNGSEQMHKNDNSIAEQCWQKEMVMQKKGEGS